MFQLGLKCPKGPSPMLRQFHHHAREVVEFDTALPVRVQGSVPEIRYSPDEHGNGVKATNPQTDPTPTGPGPVAARYPRQTPQKRRRCCLGAGSFGT